MTAYARDNIALVTVFIRDPYAAKYVRDEKVKKINPKGTSKGKKENIPSPPQSIFFSPLDHGDIFRGHGGRPSGPFPSKRLAGKNICHFPQPKKTIFQGFSFVSVVELVYLCLGLGRRRRPRGGRGGASNKVGEEGSDGVSSISASAYSAFQSPPAGEKDQVQNTTFFAWSFAQKNLNFYVKKKLLRC